MKRLELLAFPQARRIYYFFCIDAFICRAHRFHSRTESREIFIYYLPRSDSSKINKIPKSFKYPKNNAGNINLKYLNNYFHGQEPFMKFSTSRITHRAEAQNINVPILKVSRRLMTCLTSR